LVFLGYDALSRHIPSRRKAAIDCPDPIPSAPGPEQTCVYDRVSISRHTAKGWFQIPRTGSDGGTRMRFRANPMAWEHG